LFNYNSKDNNYSNKKSLPLILFFYFQINMQYFFLVLALIAVSFSYVASEPVLLALALKAAFLKGAYLGSRYNRYNGGGHRRWGRSVEDSAEYDHIAQYIQRH
jgi:hypothetical protein